MKERFETTTKPKKKVGFVRKLMNHLDNEQYWEMQNRLKQITDDLYPNYFSRKPPSGLNAQESQVWKILERRLQNRPEVAVSRLLTLILHDWTKDVLFYNKPATIWQIQMARINAMRKLIRDEKPTDVTRAFLLDSGIYKAFANSLGIDVGVITP
jgi:hypothetical protein